MRTELVLDNRRQTIYDGLTDAAKKLFDEIVQKTKTLGKLDIVTRYEIGEMLVRAVSAPNTYGTGVVENFARILGSEQAKWVLYQCKKVAERFTREELDALTSSALPNGTFVTWTHVRTLAEIEDKQERKRVASQIIKEGLSAGQLKKALSSSDDDGSSNGRSRQSALRLGTPQSVSGALAQIQAFGEALLAQAENWDRLLWSVSESEGFVADTSLVEKFRAAVVYLEEMRGLLAEHARKAKVVAEKLAAVATKRTNLLPKLDAVEGQIEEAEREKKGVDEVDNYGQRKEGSSVRASGESENGRIGCVPARPGKVSWHAAKQDIERVKRARTRS